MATRSRESRSTRAVTLVELMIVVVVLGIVAAVAAPLMTATADTRLSEAAKVLIADLQYAQMHSITHPDDLCGLRVESGGTGYTIATNGLPPFSCAGASAVTDVANDAPFVNTFGSGRAAQLSGVTISGYILGGDACVVYGSFGEIDQGTAGRITLTSGGKNLIIRMDPVTGEPTIQQSK